MISVKGNSLSVIISEIIFNRLIFLEQLNLNDCNFNNNDA